MRKVLVKKSRYVDSVTLMGISEKARKCDGAENVEIVMCTKANRELLESSGFEIEASAGPNDLVIAVNGKDEKIEEIVAKINELLNKGQTKGEVYMDLNDAKVNNDSFDICQISLPGEYAFEEGMKALKKGLHVFMFSDNVSVEEERKLKEYAVEHNLLCMGPDCGVASFGGLSLGAGSIMTIGRVGIVGASGSGAQEVGCLIESLGAGVSSLIGTGGRDLIPEIGGLMMKSGMKLLDEDKNTDVIVLVSKLANLQVMGEILNEADKLHKPTVAIFLGSDMTIFEGHKVHGVLSLEAAAKEAVKLLGIDFVDTSKSDEELDNIAKQEASKYNKQQKYIRGLYCGGTFTEEGLIYYKQNCPNIELFSNLKTKYTTQIENKDVSYRNCILDMGAEDFTAQLPHPIFEPNLRLKRLQNELADPEVALITLDFITGPGVHEDPVTSFIEEIRKHRRESKNYVTFIVNVCGSKLDPQNVAKIKEDLSNEGVIVTFSNHETAKLAARILNLL